MTLSGLMKRWREAADGDLGRRELLDPPEALRPAWSASDDPFAMVLLLAILHPGPNVAAIDALVAAMSFSPPMRQVAARQALARPGMAYNGPSMFHFAWLAMRVRQTVAESDAGTARQLAEAIRAVLPDPYTLP